MHYIQPDNHLHTKRTSNTAHMLVHYLMDIHMLVAHPMEFNPCMVQHLIHQLHLLQSSSFSSCPLNPYPKHHILSPNIPGNVFSPATEHALQIPWKLVTHLKSLPGAILSPPAPPDVFCSLPFCPHLQFSQTPASLSTPFILSPHNTPIS